MDNSMPTIRWHATAQHRTEAGLLDVEHDLEELAELHCLIERGPHWDSIEKIVILRVNHISDPALTIEASNEL